MIAGMAAIVVVVAACATPDAPAVPVAALPPRPPATAGVHPSKVLVVVEENHSASSAVQQMPYLAALADAYGQSTDYRAVAHPSLPNYLAITGGSTYGVTDDNAPASHPITEADVFDNAVTAGHTAKTYAESMPAPCTREPAGRYAVKHNAWAYFADPTARDNCQRFDVPAGTTAAGPLRTDIDAGALPTVGELIPDLCNDGHDCSLGTADNWLRQWLPVLMAGPDYRSGNLAIVVTFDEDDADSGPNTVLTTIIAPNIAHLRGDGGLTHYSLSRYLAEVSGTPPPGAAAAAASLRSAFGL